jgi:hypothetical protein
MDPRPAQRPIRDRFTGTETVVLWPGRRAAHLAVDLVEWRRTPLGVRLGSHPVGNRSLKRIGALSPEKAAAYVS